MPTYYTIIAGNRYDASLLNFAISKTRGKGDGRISREDAEEIWEVALDGGRLTETEEATLHYLLDTLTWTEAARAWTTEVMAETANQSNSYYKVIDGLRYERKILDEADERVAGKGDGRISLADAEILLPLFGDMGDITIVEERSLQYLFTNYNWTPEAQAWFAEQTDRISKQSDVSASLLNIMQTEYGFQQLRLDYYETDAVQQQVEYENKVSLPDALRQALDSFLNDTDEGNFRYNGSFTDNPKEFLEQAQLVLLPGELRSEKLASFPAPNRGESIRENWIFGLYLFDLTDDIYWAIIRRNGSQPAYHYIGGPNVGDIYHVIEQETFFTIQVQSCEEPYPGVPVDIQDPTGKFIVNRSDENGNVLVTGPAGTYSIYASDGWSFQSKTFEWDGTGKEQLKTVVLDC